MNQLSAADMEQLIRFIDFLLISVGLSALILGAFVGWYFRGQYDFNQWLKRGIWCDDCAPEVERIPGQGVDK